TLRADFARLPELLALPLPEQPEQPERAESAPVEAEPPAGVEPEAQGEPPESAEEQMGLF
ncbi:MAG: hypothetical protein QOF69_3839, partial [Solirubrobacteraceae bacterium]|nr:hypothetical protein [Solirubrobacteraceae bacterium]